MPNPVEARIEREMQEAEKVVYGNPNAAPVATPAPPVEPVVEPTVEPAAPVAVETPPKEPTVIEPVIPPELAVKAEQVTPVEPVQPEVDWKKRFTNMKASSDATIHGLRVENTALRENQQTLIARVGALEKSIADTKPIADVFDGVFTKEEQDIVGEDAIETFKKAALAAAKAEAAPLRAQLAQSQEALSKQEQNQIKSDQKKVYDEFIGKLADLVPDYKEIDENPGFAQWMEYADEASGLTRAYLFRNAQNNHDVQRVADFFNAFKLATAPPKNPLEEKVTPSAAGGAAGGAQAKTSDQKLSPMQIMKFYDDVAAGHYDKRPELRDAIEKRIDGQIRTAQQGG